MSNSQSEVRDAHRVVDALGVTLEKHEERIRSLEDDRLKVKAWAALIVFAGGLAAFFIVHFWLK